MIQELIRQILKNDVEGFTKKLQECKDVNAPLREDKPLHEIFPDCPINFGLHEVSAQGFTLMHAAALLAERNPDSSLKVFRLLKSRGAALDASWTGFKKRFPSSYSFATPLEFALRYNLNRDGNNKVIKHLMRNSSLRTKQNALVFCALRPLFILDFLSYFKDVSFPPITDIDVKKRIHSNVTNIVSSYGLSMSQDSRNKYNDILKNTESDSELLPASAGIPAAASLSSVEIKPPMPAVPKVHGGGFSPISPLPRIDSAPRQLMPGYTDSSSSSSTSSVPSSALPAYLRYSVLPLPPAVTLLPTSTASTSVSVGIPPVVASPGDIRIVPTPGSSYSYPDKTESVSDVYFSQPPSLSAAAPKRLQPFMPKLPIVVATPISVGEGEAAPPQAPGAGQKLPNEVDAAPLPASGVAAPLMAPVPEVRFHEENERQEGDDDYEGDEDREFEGELDEKALPPQEAGADAPVAAPPQAEPLPAAGAVAYNPNAGGMFPLPVEGMRGPAPVYPPEGLPIAAPPAMPLPGGAQLPQNAQPAAAPAGAPLPAPGSGGCCIIL